MASCCLISFTFISVLSFLLLLCTQQCAATTPPTPTPARAEDSYDPLAFSLSGHYGVVDRRFQSVDMMIQSVIQLTERYEFISQSEGARGGGASSFASHPMARAHTSVPYGDLYLAENRYTSVNAMVAHREWNAHAKYVRNWRLKGLAMRKVAEEVINLSLFLCLSLSLSLSLLRPNACVLRCNHAGTPMF